MAQIDLFRDPLPAPVYRAPVYRVCLVREGSVQMDRPQLRGSETAATLLRTYLADVDREYFVVLLLNRKNRLIGVNTVSVGSLTASPREVFKPAILANAAAIICGHNHPSGDPQPSQEDRLITRKLVLAGEAVGIRILDHIIISEQEHFSFADENLL